jgi:hypothetical protein
LLVTRRSNMNSRGGNRLSPRAIQVQSLRDKWGECPEARRSRVFGRYGFAKADAQPTLPAKVPANIRNIKLLREAYHSL